MKAALAWLVLIAYCGLIFGLSAQSHLPAATARISDKIWHAGAYAAMAVLAAVAAQASRSRSRAFASALFGWCFAVVYGVSDEWHQRFTPGRTPDVRDLVADAFGAALGALFCYACFARRERAVRAWRTTP